MTCHLGETVARFLAKAATGKKRLLGQENGMRMGFLVDGARNISE